MNQNGFQLKASSLTFTTFLLFTSNLDLVEKQLAALVAKTPHFFDATPILLDFTTVEVQGLPLEVENLLSLLRSYRLNPIGVKSHHQAYREIAKTHHLALIAQSDPNNAQEKVLEEKMVDQKSTRNILTTTKIIDQPIRSGKQIYVKDGDVIITAPVSHGAEVIADGNIHIYSTLHGRALAGAQGNVEARIFCKNLEAELIAIAGHYLVSENIPDEYKNQPQCLEIFLTDHQLHFKRL